MKNKHHLIIGILLFLGFIGYSQDLRFTYDDAGNEIQYKYVDANKNQASEDVSTVQVDEVLSPQEIMNNKFSVSPNPASGKVLLQWEEEMQEQITNIELLSIVNSETQTISYGKKNMLGISLAGKPTGLYLVIFYLNNPEVPSVEKKIIKL